MDPAYLRVYEEIFCYEWAKENIPHLRQHPIPLIHEAIKLGVGFRADLIIDNKVVLEWKSVELLAPFISSRCKRISN
jgi:GxxExxY protein